MTTHLAEFVYALGGRDAAKCFIVISCGTDYLYICNGKNRSVKKPKKKNPKHLHFTGIRAEKLYESLSKGQEITNKMVRYAVRKYEEENSGI